MGNIEQLDGNSKLHNPEEGASSFLICPIAKRGRVAALDAEMKISALLSDTMFIYQVIQSSIGLTYMFLYSKCE